MTVDDVPVLLTVLLGVVMIADILSTRAHRKEVEKLRSRLDRIEAKKAAP